MLGGELDGLEPANVLWVVEHVLDDGRALVDCREEEAGGGRDGAVVRGGGKGRRWEVECVECDIN